MIHVYLICNIAKNIKERYTMSTESPENLVQKSPQNKPLVIWLFTRWNWLEEESRLWKLYIQT